MFGFAFLLIVYHKFLERREEKEKGKIKAEKEEKSQKNRRGAQLWVNTEKPFFGRGGSRTEMKTYLKSYVEALIPSVFNEKVATKEKAKEVLHHHPFSWLLLGRHEDHDAETTYTTLLHFVSYTALLFFLVAWLYDIQSPSDDDSCQRFDTELSCIAYYPPLSRESYCRW